MSDDRAWLRLLPAVVATMIALTVQPGAASAHTDLDVTEPENGETVAEPVSEVTIAFTSAVELVGNGFEVLDPQGNVLQPPAVTDDDQVFRLQFAPPLAGGAVGVRYEVRADDGHTVSGSFSFVVDAPVPTTAISAPDTTVTPPTEPSATTPEATDPAAPESTTSIASTTTASPTTAGTSTTTPAGEPDTDDGSNSGLVLALAAVAALGVGGFFVIRSRTSGAS